MKKRAKLLTHCKSDVVKGHVSSRGFYTQWAQLAPSGKVENRGGGILNEGFY